MAIPSFWGSATKRAWHCCYWEEKCAAPPERGGRKPRDSWPPEKNQKSCLGSRAATEEHIKRRAKEKYGHKSALRHKMPTPITLYHSEITSKFIPWREPTPVFGSPRVDYGIRQNSTQGHRVHQNKYIFAYPLTKFGTHGAAEELLG